MLYILKFVMLDSRLSNELAYSGATRTIRCLLRHLKRISRTSIERCKPVDSSKIPNIHPTQLRKKHGETGVTYVRSAKVEAILSQLLTLPREEVALRCEIEDEGSGNFVPSECLVSLVRGCRSESASSYFERIYAALMKRILRRLPVAEVKEGKQLRLKESSIQEGVIDYFQKLLALDRTTYEERLDFWEVAFGVALKKLKTTVEVKVWRETNRSTPLENPETGEIWAHVSEAMDSSDPFDPEKSLTKDYRERLPAAIDRLTPEHRRIVTMCLKELPAYSTDPNAISIASVLKVSDKTARTRKKEALAALKRVLEKGDE